MSGKKGKAGGKTDVGAVSVGTPVRVLYDDMGWFHGDVIQVLEEDGKRTKCLVAFEDGETADAEIPSEDAQALLVPTALHAAVTTAAKGRLCTELAAVLKSKTVPEQLSDAISGACAPLADLILEAKSVFHSEKSVVTELVKRLSFSLMDPDRPLLTGEQWSAYLAALREPSEGFRFGLLKKSGEQPEGGTRKAMAKEGREGKSNATDKSKKTGMKADSAKKRGQREEEDALGASGQKSAKPADEGEADATALEKVGDGAAWQTSVLKSKGTLVEVFSDGEWWHAKVVRSRSEGGREQLFVHFKGTARSEDVWVDLRPDKVRLAEGGLENSVEEDESIAGSKSSGKKHKEQRTRVDASEALASAEMSSAVSSANKKVPAASSLLSIAGAAQAPEEAGEVGAHDQRGALEGDGEGAKAGRKERRKSKGSRKSSGGGSGMRGDAMEEDEGYSKKRKRAEDSDDPMDVQGDASEEQDWKGEGWTSIVSSYIGELGHLQNVYRDFKDSSSKVDLDRLCQEIRACHLRFHQRTAGISVGGVYRARGVQCTSCAAKIPGSRPLDVWKKGFTQCSRCGDHYEARKYCAVCHKVIRDLERENNILKCSESDLWVHAHCDGLDEMALVVMSLAGTQPYRCPHHRPYPGGNAYTIGDLTIPWAEGAPELEGKGIPNVMSIFGLRVGPDGRLLYGLEYEDAGGSGAKSLQWNAVPSPGSSASSSAAPDLTDTTLLARFLATLCPAGTLLHPCQSDARERARRWGEMVALSGGLGSPLKIGNQAMQGTSALMVDAVTGIRKLPAHLFMNAQQGAPMAAMGQGHLMQGSDVYVEVQRDGLRLWTHLADRNSTLQELVGAFLLSSVGALSIHLPPTVRETLLRQAKLWDAFCQGLGDPAVTAAKLASASVAAASNAGNPLLPWGDRSGEEGGAGMDPGGTSLVGAMVQRHGETGIVVQHGDLICRVRFDNGETVSVDSDDILDLLV